MKDFLKFSVELKQMKVLSCVCSNWSQDGLNPLIICIHSPQPQSFGGPLPQVMKKSKQYVGFKLQQQRQAPSVHSNSLIFKPQKRSFTGLESLSQPLLNMTEDVLQILQRECRVLLTMWSCPMGCLHGMSAIIETNKILRFPPTLCCGQKNRGKNVAVDEVIKKSKRQKTNKKPHKNGSFKTSQLQDFNFKSSPLSTR